MVLDQGSLKGNRHLDGGDPWDSMAALMENITLHLS